jgi:carboxymethylenebutenolidase
MASSGDPRAQQPGEPEGRPGWREIEFGTPFSAYMAFPREPAIGAVLLVHPWWGANPFMTRLADRLAANGFLVSLPDYYEGKMARTEAAAESLRDALDDGAAQRCVEAALRHLAGHGEGKVAVVGLSLGCMFALQAAASAPELVNAMVLFYGTGPGDFSRLTAPVLGHFASDDPFEPQDEVEALRTALEAGGAKVDLHIYPGAGHWFFESDREGFFDQRAAELAWERTLGFLRRNATARRV